MPTKPREMTQGGMTQGGALPEVEERSLALHVSFLDDDGDYVFNHTVIPRDDGAPVDSPETIGLAVAALVEALRAIQKRLRFKADLPVIEA